MATSGSIDFALNAQEIIEAALRRLRVLGEGESATAGQLTNGLQSLNVMTKAWNAEGITLHMLTEASAALTAGTASYDLGSGGLIAVRPLDLTQARIEESTDNEIPMQRINREAYFELPTKTDTGLPVQWYYDPQLGTGKLYVWPAPDSAYTIKFTYVRRVEDFDAAGDSADYPPEDTAALIWGLCLELAAEYGKEPSQYMLGMASRYYGILEGRNSDFGGIEFERECY